MFFGLWAALFLLASWIGAAGASACVQVHCSNAAMACCFRRSKAVMQAVDKNFSMLGKVTRVTCPAARHSSRALELRLYQSPSEPQ